MLQGFDQLVRFLRGQNRGGLVHNEDIGTTIEDLQDFDALLFANRELPNPGSRVDMDAILFGQVVNFLIVFFEVEAKTRIVETD